MKKTKQKTVKGTPTVKKMISSNKKMLTSMMKGSTMGNVKNKISTLLGNRKTSKVLKGY